MQQRAGVGYSVSYLGHYFRSCPAQREDHIWAQLHFPKERSYIALGLRYPSYRQEPQIAPAISQILLLPAPIPQYLKSLVILTRAANRNSNLSLVCVCVVSLQSLVCNDFLETLFLYIPY